MARPKKKRLVCCEPAYDVFSPAGIPSDTPVTLTLDEYETIRLIEYENLTQEQCAERMGVARTTITAIHESARYKIADCLVNGRELHVRGGHYSFCAGNQNQCDCYCPKKRQVTPRTLQEKGVEEMRIAIPYENGNIFQHFGHTAEFKIYDIQNNEIAQTQILSSGESGHGALADLLSHGGVDVLICGGIGGGAQNALAAAGIQLYGGVQGSADEAATAFAHDALSYDPRARCDHHDHGGHSDEPCGSHGCGSHSCH